MVRPEHFGYNEETAASNAFQKEVLLCEYQNVRQCALEEFALMVNMLERNGVEVMVFDSPKGVKSPDAVFPNNWISLHDDGTVVLYPMLASSRRGERRQEVIDEIGKKFMVTQIIDLSPEEEKGRFLEGTGSIVFDHIHRVAWANGSPRTDEGLFRELCQKLEYEAVFFKAVDENGQDIYHTNVLMAIGTGYAVVCAEAIVEADRDRVLKTMEENGLKVMEIGYEQLRGFAGNIIELENKNGERLLAMSETARNILTEAQHAFLRQFAKPVSFDSKNIETVGGGSVRCMIADIHLPRA